MELNAKIFLETDGSYMLLVEEGKGTEAYMEVTEAELKQMAAAYAEASKKKKERGEKAVEEVKMIGKKAKVKAFLTKLLAAKKAKKAVKQETSLPLVSKEEYKKHLEMLKLIYKNSQASYDKQKKPKVADRSLYETIKEHFVSEGVLSHHPKLLLAFINGLTYIYNKKKRGEIDWTDWFDASKTGQEYGNEWTQTDNYVQGSLPKFFNIYVSDKGDHTEPWRRKDYGYFFGF